MHVAKRAKREHEGEAHDNMKYADERQRKGGETKSDS
jgi:hypothetical protein